MTNIIDVLNKEEIGRVSNGRKIPSFRPGDTLRVKVKISEGDREREERTHRNQRDPVPP